ncbi:MAG: hypothetical protein SWN98_16150 [Pseudomonadota bacterium]|jgi:hypothetical protein|uniref:Uncharacterized protein n=1 Tax=Actibacterium naphthalenivorans TaxID=1614693 RepID=A0A840CB18_9RHOB|nr:MULTISPECIES: hypothetical protein [Actibacterium]MBB4023264.1 hypothetical protein [Actibacterium naphthalenivorans]MDY6860860.1 hypothetical protein [Pseudomonadota bacterium]|tara:strand:+ start:609 stop:749 length:141 start_codon:yes stop_codon:yes gene_type:complete
MIPCLAALIAGLSALSLFDQWSRAGGRDLLSLAMLAAGAMLVLGQG